MIQMMTLKMANNNRVSNFSEFIKEAKPGFLSNKYSTEEITDILEVEYEREDFNVDINMHNGINLFIKQTFPDDSEVGILLDKWERLSDVLNGEEEDIDGNYSIRVKRIQRVKTIQCTFNSTNELIINEVTRINQPIMDRITAKYPGLILEIWQVDVNFGISVCVDIVPSENMGKGKVLYQGKWIKRH